MRIAHLLICLGAFILIADRDSAFGQGTAFTYQGCLKDGGQAAIGTYDFRFRLAVDCWAGSYAGNPCFAEGIAVSDGLFTTRLDFGPGIFTGANYWLEVSVRTNGAAKPYTVLAPLQPITPAPYSVFADEAANISGTLPVEQLPPTVVTNGAGAVSLSGVFKGNGAGLTNVFSPIQGDYLFAYSNVGVQSNGTFSTFKYVVGHGSNITFNTQVTASDWTTSASSAGQVFVAAHSGLYWVQYTVCDTYLQGGYPHFQATLNGAPVPGSQCTPIMQGSTTTGFLTSITAGGKLGIQCTAYSSETLGTWNAGFFASLTVLRIK